MHTVMPPPNPLKGGGRISTVKTVEMLPTQLVCVKMKREMSNCFPAEEKEIKKRMKARKGMERPNMVFLQHRCTNTIPIKEPDMIKNGRNGKSKSEAKTVTNLMPVISVQPWTKIEAAKAFFRSTSKKRELTQLGYETSTHGCI